MARAVARSLSAAAALIVTLRAGSALASPPYSDDLRADLALSYLPPCSLCHGSTSDAGADGPSIADAAVEAGAVDASVGPANTPFARSMKARGLVADSATSMVTAIAAMRRDDVDSDGDGATDLDELSWGGDPNVADLPASSPDDRAPIAYGCAMAVARRGGPLGLVALVVGVALVRRARRRRG